MSTILKILALVANATGALMALGTIPGVSLNVSILIIGVATAVHGLADVISDYLDNGKQDWRSPLVIGALFIGGLSLASLTACSSSAGSASPAGTPSGAPAAGGSSTGTQTLTTAQLIALDFKGLTNDVLSFANGLEKVNNGQLLTNDQINAILALTHNTGDAATAQALNSLLSSYVAATSNAAATGGTQSQVQAAGTQVLVNAQTSGTGTTSL